MSLVTLIVFYMASFFILLHIKVLFVGMLFSENNSIMYCVKSENKTVRNITINTYFPLIYGYGYIQWAKSSYARQSEYNPYESIYHFPIKN